MLTEEEFKEKFAKLRKKQRKFVLRYIENGCDAKEAAAYAGYKGCYLVSPIYRIMRRVNDVIDYLIAKNNIVQSVVKPYWIFDQYLKLYDSTTSELTKQNILKELSKLLQMQSETSKVEVNNNINNTPVQIVFNDEE